MSSKGSLRPEDLVVVDLDGMQVSGTRKATSEIRLHLFQYQQRPELYSVVHAHPPHATAFALARRELPKCLLPEIELFLGEIPIAPYATTGTWEFARSIGPWVTNHDAFLLTNHGAVTAGLDPFDAYYRMETVDQYCHVLLLTLQAGGWHQLGAEQMNALMVMKGRWGVADQRTGALDAVHHAPGPATDPGSGRTRFLPHPGPLEDRPKLIGKDDPARAQRRARLAAEVAAEVLRRSQRI